MTLFQKNMGRLLVASLAVAALAALPGISRAVEVAGVNYAAQLQAGGQLLQLNGAGIRRKANANLYSAALYLGSPARSADEVLASPGPKQLRVFMLQDLNSRDMADMLSRGLVTNNPDDDLAAIVPEMLELGSFIADRGKLLTGDGFQIEWNPAIGTTITVFQRNESKPIRQVFEKKDLIAPMMKIWLGTKPADPELKAALLGKRA
ncbi:chalcone isomerase family protein [Curvibacter sp. APW13]|uniref:chalcone isomerase family protein n=1 Tax=Curvibacter sp. APW13 TaxID=3077236 RepID=UPI0028E0633B|nr:chalcone isomerase family protein [Curvibacter sp. APW13]MDT8989321.1 chalcone isomerase family protein [Curvibacter sp. APW13]